MMITITLEMLPNYKQFPEVSLYADKYAMNKIIEMIHFIKNAR